MKDNYRTHVVSRRVLGPVQRASLIEVAETDGFRRYDVLDPDTNRVLQEIHDLRRNKQNMWIYQKMEHWLWPLSNKHWGFKLSDWQQELRVAKYLPGYVHDWHLDYMPSDASKLAFSIPLNDGFTGGAFEMLGVHDPIELHPGDAVVFPAYHAHRVTPVELGVRYVLLGWVTGPRFI